jgi:hypothetical protein
MWGTMGLGLTTVSSERRVPRPPARMTVFKAWLGFMIGSAFMVKGKAKKLA